MCIAKQSRVRTHNPVTATPDQILAQNTTLRIARAIGTFAAVMWTLPIVGARRRGEWRPVHRQWVAVHPLITTEDTRFLIKQHSSDPVKPCTGGSDDHLD